jgi:hypothetical protein
LLVRPHKQPGRLDRRHFEPCVFTYLAEELRTGDVAVKGSEVHANWAAKLLSWEECDPLLGEFCAEAGLPAATSAFTGQPAGEGATHSVERDGAPLVLTA